MEHHHHELPSEPQHETPLSESTGIHHDKVEESPKCTDSVNQVEPVLTTTMDKPLDEGHGASLASQEEQQPFGTQGISTLAQPKEQGGQDDNDQEISPTTSVKSTEISHVCHGPSDGADETKLTDNEEDSNLERSDTNHSDVSVSAPTYVALLGDTNHQPIQSSSTHTKDTETTSNQNGTDGEQAGNSSTEAGTNEGQHKPVDQLITNVTSGDDKDTSENHRSVDIVDDTSFVNNNDDLSTTTDHGAVSQPEQYTSTQPIVPANDNTTDSGYSTPALGTAASYSTTLHHDLVSTGQGDDDQGQQQDDDDDLPLISPYEGDRNTMIPSASTTTATTSLSISTGQHQVPGDDQPLARVTTTGSDEQTLSEPPRPRHVWESDRQASECRRCNRRFSFLVRRHHCRRCGQIVCDRCSSHRVRLPVEELVEDPLISTSHYPIIALTPQRVCESCVRIPIKATDSGGARYSTPINHNHRGDTTGFGHRPHPMNMQRTDSQQSLMTECPVCGTGLLGMRKGQQETHLNQCLNTGSPTVRPPRYIIYTLTEGTAQVGDECPICFEEFEVGNKIARMVCLCSYHRHCLRDWLERGKGCPIHYDSNIGTY